jgi:methylenetetrahydrofolate reductase (NADPH)
MIGTTLMRDASIGVSAAHTRNIGHAVPWLPRGFSFNVGHIDFETARARLAAVVLLKKAGFNPTLHLAARRFLSECDLRRVLDSLSAVGDSADLFVVGGDPLSPAGPFASALDIITLGLAGSCKARTISIGGHPSGHPNVSTHDLWTALEEKARTLHAIGSAGQIITQLALDPRATADWIHEVRDRGVTMPIRIGIPGPMRAAELMGYATRFGVTATAIAERTYGLHLAASQDEVNAERFVDELESLIDPHHDQVIGVHVFTFADLESTARWVAGMGELSDRPVGGSSDHDQ